MSTFLIQRGHMTRDMLMRYSRDATAVDRIRERLDEHLARKKGKTGTSTDALEKLAALLADKL